MMTKEEKKVYGRENRLAEIRRIINRPEQLEDIQVDMAYTILASRR